MQVERIPTCRARLLAEAGPTCTIAIVRGVIRCKGAVRSRPALIAPVVLRLRLAVGVAMGVMLIACAVVAAVAQQPKLDHVVSRLGKYLAEYEHRLSLVVAEERYQQSVDMASDAPTGNGPPDAPEPPAGHQDRSLRSDYALTRASDKQAWVGYRDTFEVDGRPVRDRDDRLQRTLTDGVA